MSLIRSLVYGLESTSTVYLVTRTMMLDQAQNLTELRVISDRFQGNGTIGTNYSWSIHE